MDQPGRSKGFFINVAWTWLGVAANLLTILLLSPYIIRSLGAEGYGLWALVFSFVGYYGFLDFGFRSALIYFSGHYRAKGDTEKINEVINSVLFYYSAAAIAPLTAGLMLARPAARWFHVSAQHQDDFSALVVITAIASMLGINVFGAVLEGFQRFDASSRIYIATMVLRAAGTVAVLASGHGLLALGLNYLAVQLAGILLSYFALRRAFPQLRLAPALVKFSMLKSMAAYGIHTFVANIGYQLLSQSTPVIIGLFRPAAFVGYFSLPYRMMQYATDFVVRMGGVTNSTAVELAAQDRRDTLIRLGAFSNRYSFMLFVPLVAFLLVYARELITVWVGPEFALHAAPLVPILAAGSALAVGGQFNTSTMLFSLNKHKEYGRALLVESALTVAAVLALLPSQGILGAAWGSAVPMIVVRGLYAPWLLCRTLQCPLGGFLLSIYAVPLLTGLPVLAIAIWLKRTMMSGETWYELIAAGALIGVLYLSAAIFTCVDADHRDVLRKTLSSAWQRLQGAAA